MASLPLSAPFPFSFPASLMSPRSRRPTTQTMQSSDPSKCERVSEAHSGCEYCSEQPLLPSPLQPVIYRYALLLLDGERHCESKLSCRRTQHSDPGRGSKLDHSTERSNIASISPTHLSPSYISKWTWNPFSVRRSLVTHKHYTYMYTPVATYACRSIC